MFPAFSFDENLQEIPNSVKDFNAYIEEVESKLGIIETKERQQALALLGVACRIIRRLDQAEAYLLESLELCSPDNIVSQINAKTRLAHVYQWKRLFSSSNSIFSDIESNLLAKANNQTIIATYWQHRGKNEFDQGNFDKALFYFEKALELRSKGYGAPDQLESTKDAIHITKKRIQNN